MQSTFIKTVGILILCLAGQFLQAQHFTITSDKESASCGNQHVTFEAGFIEVGTTYGFNSGRLPDDWASSPYNLGQACSGIFANTTDASSYFWATINDSDGHRFVSTNDLDLQVGGQITFSMRFGRDDPSSGCENPDEPSEGVYLQYSTDGGAHWITFKYWVPHQIGGITPDGLDLYRWNEFTVAIPETAKTNNTRFRWFQPSNSGSSYDNWGLDDISVFVLREAQTYRWDIGDGQNYEEQTLKVTFESDGPQTINCTVTDAEGISYANTISYEVNIDDEAPVAQAANYFLVLDEQGQASLIADYLDGGSSDNCSEINFSVDKENFDCDDLGDNTVMLTVTDNAGNLSTTTATVSVYDFTAPLVVTKDIVIQLDKEGNASVRAEQIDGGSSDACSDTLTLNLSKSHFTREDLGENTITLTVTDERGNSSAATASITIEDVSAPEGYTVKFEEDIINAEQQTQLAFSILHAEVGAKYAYTLSSESGAASISGSGIVSASDQIISDINVSSFPEGILILSLTLEDISGNLGAAATASVFKDTTVPAVEITSSIIDPTHQAFVANITFSEAVSGFALDDISLTNASATHLQSEDQRHFTVEIHPIADGLLIVDVEAGTAMDSAGNTNQTATAPLSLTYDATPPSGYALHKELKKVNTENVSNYSFKLEGLEVGTQLYYTLRNVEGGPSVEGKLEVDQERLLISDINLLGLADGTLELSFYLEDKAGNRGEIVKVNTQKSTVEIVAVETFADVKVPFATAFEELKLPEQIEVSYSTGEKAALKVAWMKGNFNPNEAGTYVLEGKIILEACTNTQNFKAEIKVEVGRNLSPTQIFLSALNFNPDIASEQAIGSFSTKDADDEVHTYALVAGEGDTDNSLFSIIGNELFLTSNRGISGQTSFSIRVRTSDAYANGFEAVFTLSKSPYAEVESINFVNTFSPNGDGINEVWMVPDLKFFNEVSIEVFDRSGRRVFQTHDPEQGWDGSVNGSVQNEGYYYIISIKDIQLTKRGVLSVIK